MTTDQAIAELKQYIERDNMQRTGEELTDYDKFCIQHCKAIEILIKALEG